MALESSRPRAIDSDATGIRHPSRPDRWLVPPWPAIPTVHEVVRHFLRFQPRGESTPEVLVAFYRGYATALMLAQTDDLCTPAAQHWFVSLRRCVDTCATNAEVEANGLRPFDQVAWVSATGLTIAPDDYEKVS